MFTQQHFENYVCLHGKGRNAENKVVFLFHHQWMLLLVSVIKALIYPDLDSRHGDVKCLVTDSWLIIYCTLHDRGWRSGVPYKVLIMDSVCDFTEMKRKTKFLEEILQDAWNDLPAKQQKEMCASITNWCSFKRNCLIYVLWFYFNCLKQLHNTIFCLKIK